MLVLAQEDLIGLIPPLETIAAVEAALHAQEAGQLVAPQRLHMHWDDNSLLTMPAAAQEGVGVKIVSVAPGNANLRIPVTNGIMILNDRETGAPLAILNAAALTAQRTGAVGALGVKYLTPADTSSVGIIGCGVQGAWQAIYACAVRPINEIFAFDRSPVGFERFAKTVSQHAPGVRITACRDARELLERTSLVIAATTSTEPVLPDEPRWLENKHFISVGSFRPTMQELPDSVYRLARCLAIDSESARHEAGDVINALQRKILQETDIFSVAECVAGKRTIDISRTTVYKTVGSAVYDLFVALALYRAAKARGLGREIAL